MDSRRIPLVPRYSGYLSLALEFRIQGYHLILLIFPDHSAIPLHSFNEVLQPSDALHRNLGSSRFDRLY